MTKHAWSVGLGLLFCVGVALPAAPSQSRVLQGGIAALGGKAGKLTFEIYEDNAKEYRWRLKAANGEILATAGQGYKAKRDCQEGVDRIKTQANSDKVTFEVYEDKAKEHRWRLKAANGQVIAASSEGYKAKADCDRAIALIRKEASKAEVVEKKVDKK